MYIYTYNLAMHSCVQKYDGTTAHPILGRPKLAKDLLPIGQEIDQKKHVQKLRNVDRNHVYIYMFIYI